MAAPAPKPWLLSPDEVVILKNAVCKGATDEELKYCLAVARRFELDPFQQQVWFVPRWDSAAENSEGKQGGKIYVPVVGINGLQHVAARDHADYGSVSQPEYGPLIEVKGVANKGKYGGKPYTFKAPEWARVKVFKKGSAQPTIGEVWWTEIYPDVDFAPLVRRMPRLMLAKCARAQAIRIAYPKTGGLLIPEETHTREFEDITPGGRLISEAPAVPPAEQRYLDREKEQLDMLTPEQREVVDRRMKEAEERKNAPIDIQPPRTVGANERPKQEETHTTTHTEPQLVYRHYSESDTWRIGGSSELVKAHMDLLQPLWSVVAKAFVANAKQLGHLIRQFELRKVPFREYGAQREPGE